MFVLGWVALRGIRESAWVTNGLVVIKVLVCVFVIAVGAFYVNTGNLVPFIPESQPRRADGGSSSSLHAPLWQFLSGVEPATFGLTGIFVAAAVVVFA